MKTLDRNRIDQLVRELETEAYRLALTVAPDSAAAERIVLRAFASLAPSLAATPQIVELKERLHARIRRPASRGRSAAASIDDLPVEPVVVSENLHLRIVDLLEEEQAVEPVGRRRVVLLSVGGAVLIGAVAALLWVRADALAVAQPRVTNLNPPAGAKEVPVRGDFTITFGGHPVGTPTLRLEPPDGTLEPARWDGSTLTVSYSGLRLATRYQLVLAADYRSRLKDLGHYEKRWTVTTEGYPVLVTVFPQDGQSIVPRVGQLSVAFTHRPPVPPHLSLEPADGTLLADEWNGTTLTVSYSGLKPLTRYLATVTVDYGVKNANIRRQWAFSTEPGAPPAGVPLIWYSGSSPWLQPSGIQRLVAIDWSGKLVGTNYQTFATQQAPDGSVFFTSDRGLVDRNGMQISTPTGIRSNPMIADDSKSLCDIVDIGGGQLWLMTGPLRGPLHRVASMGVAGARGGPVIIACSVANDRAVLADIGMTGATAVRVVKLTTGRILYQASHSELGLGMISSGDGQYLVEQIPTYDAQGQPLAAVSVIRRTSDGRVMARIDKQRVLRFSWDDRRVVTAPFFPGLGPTDVELLEWQTGKVLWRLPGSSATEGGRTVYAMPQPNGPSMAIAASSQPGNGDVDQLWLVTADGQATQALNEVFYPAFYAGF
ncbi:MAG TPA: Ig-like domain-containing protein [Candidatus Dormibacteraeota bacterium]